MVVVPAHGARGTKAERGLCSDSGCCLSAALPHPTPACYVSSAPPWGHLPPTSLGVPEGSAGEGLHVSGTRRGVHSNQVRPPRTTCRGLATGVTTVWLWWGHLLLWVWRRGGGRLKLIHTLPRTAMRFLVMRGQGQGPPAGPHLWVPLPQRRCGWWLKDAELSAPGSHSRVILTRGYGFEGPESSDEGPIPRPRFTTVIRPGLFLGLRNKVFNWKKSVKPAVLWISACASCVPPPPASHPVAGRAYCQALPRSLASPPAPFPTCHQWG